MDSEQLSSHYISYPYGTKLPWYVDSYVRMFTSSPSLTVSMEGLPQLGLGERPLK